VGAARAISRQEPAGSGWAYRLVQRAVAALRYSRMARVLASVRLHSAEPATDADSPAGAAENFDAHDGHAGELKRPQHGSTGLRNSLLVAKIPTATPRYPRWGGFTGAGAGRCAASSTSCCPKPVRGALDDATGLRAAPDGPGSPMASCAARLARARP